MARRKAKSPSARDRLEIASGKASARDKAEVLGAHPLHSDKRHAMTGASFIPTHPRYHVHKAFKIPKGFSSKKRGRNG